MRRLHWTEYAAESLGLGLFMFLACVLGTALGHPDSPLVRARPDATERRALMGVLMGVTAIALIRSPWGQRSGAHINPATTLTYWRLGTIATADAVGYGVAQAAGGAAGVLAASALLGERLAHVSVRYVATTPGAPGAAAAFLAEALIAGLLMTVVLEVSNRAGWSRFTPFCVGALVALYITVEAPISGMSMNPARSFASAVGAGTWETLWIYLAAPPLGMLLAAEAYVRRRGLDRVYCAKLDHDHGRPCIFRCRFHQLGARRAVSTSAALARRA